MPAFAAVASMQESSNRTATRGSCSASFHLPMRGFKNIRASRFSVAAAMKRNQNLRLGVEQLARTDHWPLLLALQLQLTQFEKLLHDRPPGFSHFRRAATNNCLASV